MNRRTVLSTVGGTIASLAGCGAFDYPANRSLGVFDLSVEETDTGWILRITVEATANGFADPQKEAFHDVVLHVFAENWVPVCTKCIGDFPDLAPSEKKQVTVQCRGFPHHITFEARQSPCDPNTTIRIISYQGRYEDVGRQWRPVRERSCGEGLPPRPES